MSCRASPCSVADWRESDGKLGKGADDGSAAVVD